jgi:hypothetical protein
LSKSREFTVIEYDQEIIDEVERLLISKDMILNEGMDEPITDVCDESKENVGYSLLAMNVQVRFYNFLMTSFVQPMNLCLQTKDIAKMLDVGEKTVQKWKSKMIKAEIKEEENEEYENEDLQVGTEYVVEYLE